MRVVGVVGSEAAKFTPETEQLARAQIRRVIATADQVVSGACHLGGIDIWAIEEAKALGIAWREFPPVFLHWEGGYKQRNIRIADASTEVFCITVRVLPPGYTGMRFEFCYHCRTDTHVKSGGCWTTRYARGLGKRGETIVV